MAEDEGEAGWLRPVHEDGTPAGPVEPVSDLAATIAAEHNKRRKTNHLRIASPGELHVLNYREPRPESAARRR